MNTRVLEFRQAARVLVECFGRPWPLALGAQVGQIGRQRLAVAGDVGEKLGDAHAASPRPGFKQVGGCGVDLDLAQFHTHACNLVRTMQVVEGQTSIWQA
jgi:hypothetical protein